MTNWKTVIIGVMVALAGAELVLINTILVLGNAVYYASSIERFVEGSIYFIAGMVAVGIGYELVERGVRYESGNQVA